MMATMSLSEYKGIKSVSLRVLDIRPHGIRQDRFFAADSAYESFMRGESIGRDVLEKGSPDREELVAVYKYISAQKTPLTFERLYAGLSGRCNAFKLHIITDAFLDTGLLKCDSVSGTIEPVTAKAKVDIESSKTLKRLHSLIQGGDSNA